MSLIRVHRVLIAAAIALCAGFAVRDVATGDGGPCMVLRVAASGTAAIVLALYLRLVLTRVSATSAATIRMTFPTTIFRALRSARERDN